MRRTEIKPGVRIYTGSGPSFRPGTVVRLGREDQTGWGWAWVKYDDYIKTRLVPIRQLRKLRYM